MSEIKEIFCVKGKKSKYPGRESVVNSVIDGNNVPLIFRRADDEKITLVDPITNEDVGFVPIVVCLSNPSREDSYDMLECFVDMGIANPVAIKTRRDDIVIEVHVVL